MLIQTDRQTEIDGVRVKTVVTFHMMFLVRVRVKYTLTYIFHKTFYGVKFLNNLYKVRLKTLIKLDSMNRFHQV